MGLRVYEESFKMVAVELSKAKEHQQFNTKAEAKLALFEYIDIFYNRQRRHSELSYLTPCKQEALLLQKYFAT